MVVGLVVTYTEMVLKSVGVQNRAADEEKYQQELEQEKLELMKGTADLTGIEAQLQQEKNKQTAAIVIGGLVSVGILGGIVFLMSPAKKRKRVKS